MYNSLHITHFVCNELYINSVLILRTFDSVQMMSAAEKEKRKGEKFNV